MGGPRAVLLGALLLTVGLAPTTASQETCAGAGPAELCIGDPLVHDAGEATVEDGDVSAHANGGLAAGAGSATFAVDYLLDDETIGPEHEIWMSARLIVEDNDGSIVSIDSVSETLLGPGSLEGQLQTTVETLTPELEGGTITVEVDATLHHESNATRLGDAVSMAPITVLLSPPGDLADRTNVGETEVGTFGAGPAEAGASVADGELFVADGTSTRLEVTGELSTQSVDDVDFVTQYASASLRADVGGSTYFVSVTPLSDDCNQACSIDAQTVNVELSIVLPGDADEVLSDLDLRLDADWYLRTPDPDGWGSQLETNEAVDRGANELVAFAP